MEESGVAYEEWKTYYRSARDEEAVSRNIQALAADFVQNESYSPENPRHLFVGAITPGGLTTRIDTLFSSNTSVFSVKGSPGSGLKDLFKYVLGVIELAGVYAEVFHNPFDPAEIDLIWLPGNDRMLLDTSSSIFNYVEKLPGLKVRRILDFDTLLNTDKIDSSAKYIASVQDRFDTGLKDAINFIQSAKKYHDELESYYIPAMDFDAINEMRLHLQDEISSEL